MKNKPSYSVFVDNSKKKFRPLVTYLYFPLSYPLSYILYIFGCSPNLVSFFGIVLAVIGGVLILYGSVVFGLILLLLSYILDFCDGNIARYKYRFLKEHRSIESEKLGLLLENLYANVSYFCLFIPVGFYLSVTEGTLLYLFTAAMTYCVKLMTRYTVIHTCFINEKVKNRVDVSKPDPLFESTRANSLKYFFTGIIDNARIYFVSFLLVLVVFPDNFKLFFICYLGYIFALNLLKLFLTLKRLLP